MKFIVMRDPLTPGEVLLVKREHERIVVCYPYQANSGKLHWGEVESEYERGALFYLSEFILWQKGKRTPTVAEARKMLGVAE